MKPVVIDGALWVCIALWGTMQGMLTTDEAYKYVSPVVLFWAKFTVACLASSFGALKAFRSTSYAQHVQTEKDIASRKVTATVTDVHSTEINQPDPAPPKDK